MPPSAIGWALSHASLPMKFKELLRFIEHDMQMSHVYQPVMLRTLLAKGGQATTEQIAANLLAEDRAQLEYYTEIVKKMVGRVLKNRGLVERDGNEWVLVGGQQLTKKEITALIAACEQRLAEYVGRRGDRIWDHRRRSVGYVSGTLRYDVLKAAQFHCELCGVSADERALEVDHIVPRNHGGTDDLTNLQAPLLPVQCYETGPGCHRLSGGARLLRRNRSRLSVL